TGAEICPAGDELRTVRLTGLIPTLKAVDLRIVDAGVAIGPDRVERAAVRHGGVEGGVALLDVGVEPGRVATVVALRAANLDARVVAVQARVPGDLQILATARATVAELGARAAETRVTTRRHREEHHEGARQKPATRRHAVF